MLEQGNCFQDDLATYSAAAFHGRTNRNVIKCRDEEYIDGKQRHARRNLVVQFNHSSGN